MKAIYKLPFLLWATIFLVSCDKDNDDQAHLPVISDLEIGHDNNRIGYVDEDLHIEAEIFAPNKIKTVEISISHKNNPNGWNVNKVYTEFENLINTEFHEHLYIPSNALLGKYDFNFKVTDLRGYEYMINADFIIRETP